MAARDYYPDGDTMTLQWVDHFNAKVPNYAATFGLSGAQLSNVQAHFDAMKQKLSEVEAAKNTLKSLVAAKSQVMKDAESFIRNLVATMKLNASYTQAIGEDLNVIAPAARDEATLIANAKPEFWATVLAILVRLDWPKGDYDGILFESKRGNETTFTLLDKDDRSPCEDKRPNLVAGVPEIRIYRAIYLLNGVPVGNWSEEVRVTVLI